MERLQRDLRTIHLTDIRQRAEEASIAIAEQLRAHLDGANQRLRRFRKRSNRELNEAILRLKDERLPNGKRRSFKQVRAALKKINPRWVYSEDDPIRMRYKREKKKQSPPGP
jgi:hypothetical protein